MPRLIVPESRTETVVDAMLFLLARDGPAGLTLRAIARESRVSAPSLVHHFGSRERLLLVGAGQTGMARLRSLEARFGREGVGAFLPAVVAMIGTQHRNLRTGSTPVPRPGAQHPAGPRQLSLSSSPARGRPLGS